MFACGNDYCEATPGKTGEAARPGKHWHAHCREGPTSVTVWAATQVTAGELHCREGFQMSHNEAELLS